jgi:AAHS family 4-hydroxybenzoate transporter-like MFS transporter
MIDVRAAIGAAPLGSMHYRLASLIGLVVLFDGYDTLNPSYVIHYVAGPWNLTGSQSGFIVSSGLIGFLIGAIAQGPLADRLGRRAVLIGALWIAAAFTLATALFATNFATFCSLRFLTGLGLGALLPAGITYINEIAPNRIRNSFSVWGWLLGWVLGGIAAAAAGIILTPHFGWQALYFLGSSSFLIAIACQIFLPESPAYSALRGDSGAVSAFLMRFDPAHAKKYENARFVLPEDSSNVGSFGLLMSPRYRRTTISVWLASFCCLFAMFGLTGWLPTVLLNRGDGFVASFGSGALLLVMSLVGGLGTGAIADRTHRDRTLMVVSLIAGACSIFALTFVQRSCRAYRPIYSSWPAPDCSSSVRRSCSTTLRQRLTKPRCAAPPSARCSESRDSAQSPDQSSAACCSSDSSEPTASSAPSPWHRSPVRSLSFSPGPPYDQYRMRRRRRRLRISSTFFNPPTGGH